MIVKTSLCWVAESVLIQTGGIIQRASMKCWPYDTAAAAVTFLLVTQSGLKRSLEKKKRGNFRLSRPDLCGWVAPVAVSCVRSRPGHTWFRNAQMPRVVVNLPEWLASRWHPYATLISALQNCRRIKIAFEDCFSCSLRSSQRLSVVEKIWTVFSFVAQLGFLNEGGGGG